MLHFDYVNPFTVDVFIFFWVMHQNKTHMDMQLDKILKVLQLTANKTCDSLFQLTPYFFLVESSRVESSPTAKMLSLTCSKYFGSVIISQVMSSHRISTLKQWLESTQIKVNMTRVHISVVSHLQIGLIEYPVS